jgi:hypothetical protein
MKPGQAVEVASGPDAEWASLKGHVARASRDEIVVNVENPHHLSFAPHSCLEICYRDAQGDHHVPARVVSVEGEDRLILAPSIGESPQGDARRKIRVEHLLRMEYHVIPPEEMEATCRDVLNGPRILKYEWQQASQPVAAGTENESVDASWEGSPIGERLQRIELKLDALLERLGVDAPALAQRPLYNVNLSATGLRFRDFQRRCQAGDMVYICIELPLDPTVEIRAIAETLYVVEDSRHSNLSTGYDVVLEFRGPG